ncbi:MAG: AMIN domain-containing protein [Epsilonproteobacteria bacterium]|nr:AMIN domain-containing protein [Campylobacterota bacterium]
MIRLLIVLALFCFYVDARENPFFPVVQKEVELTSNQVQTQPPLKQASISLPSTARSIESVTISYKNLDGSIQEKKVDLQNSIDWHLPIFISQSYLRDSAEKKISAKLHKKANTKYKTVAKLPFISFKVQQNRILLVTKDKMLRSFLLVRPHRIVSDFQRETDIRSYVKKIPKGSVAQVRVGTHKGYYRVVIELDGSYRYTYKKMKNGYLFTLL